MPVIVTKDFIEKHTGIGINASQCKILGFEWKELTKGWRDRVENSVISNASAELFRRLKGAQGKKNQSKIIQEFKLELKIKKLHHKE